MGSVASSNGRRVSVRWKLLGTVGVVLGLMAVVGATAVLALRSVEQRSASMYDQALEPSLAAAGAAVGERRSSRDANHGWTGALRCRG